MSKLDIVKFEDGSKYIIVGMESRENSGSCAYDRTYSLLPYNKEKTLEVVTTGGYTGGSIRVTVSRTTTLPFKVTKKHYYTVHTRTHTKEEGKAAKCVTKLVRNKY